MFCAISGKACISPVFLPQDGHLYERDLIVKYIEKNDKSPHSTEKVSVDDLIKVENSTASKPTPPSFTSVPSLLVAMQQEWDAVMLESFELKQQLNEAQQELSNCLYENDAAKRVIARLLKERDEAREKLSQYSGSPAKKAAKPAEKVPDEDDEMQLDLPEDVASLLEEKANELTEWRRKKKASETLTPADSFKSFEITNTVKTLNTAKEPTVSAMSLNQNNEWILAAGLDGNCSIVEKSSGKALCSSKTHKQAVNDAVWIDECRFLSGSADSAVKIWNVESQKNGYKIKNVGSVDGHSGEVKSLDLHATKSYFGSAGTDCWNFSDIESAKVISTYQSGDVEFTSLEFHPDGLITAVGDSKGAVKLWDIKTGQIATTFEGHGSEILSTSFSQNGYHFATTGGDAVKFWDLRKLAEFHSIQLEQIGRVRFDYSGKYVGVAHGTNLSLFMVKKWDELQKFEHHSAKVTDFLFGTDCKYIVTAAAERKLCVLSAPQE